MIKEYFMDVFLQLSIVLSLFSYDNQDISVYNQLNGLQENINGELAVSPIINIHSEYGQNPDLGVHVHPKNVRVEDVLRGVHSLGHYGRVRGISSDVVNAFLVDETTNTGLSAGNCTGGGTSGRSAAGGDNGMLNPPLAFGEDPTKEDMDLIDILWRHDVDLESAVDPPFSWESETQMQKELEDVVNLAAKQETDLQDALYDATRESPFDTDTNDIIAEELHTPDILDRTEFSIFSEQVRTHENLERDWSALMNHFGVDGDLTDGSHDVDGELFSNLFAFRDNPEAETPRVSLSETNDSPTFDPVDQLHNTSPEFFSDTGFFDMIMQPDWMAEMEGFDFDNLPELLADDGYLSAPSVTDEGHASRSSFSTVDSPFQVDRSPKDALMTKLEESVFAPPESEPSTSGTVGSGCGPSAGRAWADPASVGHDHTYSADPKPPSVETKVYDERVYAPVQTKKKKNPRNKDDRMLKEMQIPFSADEIIHNEIDWFADVVASAEYSLTSEQVDFMREVRKRGRNKGAAQKCRKKKQDSLQSLERDVECLLAGRKSVDDKSDVFESTLDKVTRKFARLQQDILEVARSSGKKHFAKAHIAFSNGAVYAAVDAKETERGSPRGPGGRRPTKRKLGTPE